jgi:NADH-quinone oxidoreductase subunit N
MAVCILALLGMPLVGGMGFFAKWYLLQAALQATSAQTVLSVIVVLSSAVSAAYYLPILAAMFMQPRPSGHAVRSSVTLSDTVIIAAAVLLLVIGVYPTSAARLARRASLTPFLQPAPDPATPRGVTATGSSEP